MLGFIAGILLTSDEGSLLIQSDGLLLGLAAGGLFIFFDGALLTFIE